MNNDKLLALIRVRGTVGVRKDIAETLKRLRLPHVNNLSLVFPTPANIGMIKKCINYITYGEISQEMLSKLLEKKEIKLGKEDIDALLAGKKKASELMPLPIRLRPPKHGYEGIKKHFKEGGALGYRGAEINKLINRMV